MAKLQLSGPDGGFRFSRCKTQLGAHIWVMVDWLKYDPATIRLDTESSQTKRPL